MHLRRGEDPARMTRCRRRSRRPIPGVDARSMNEVQANFGSLMGQVDTFLLMTVSLALIVGIVGIINTMLMSTTERFVEFGVLRTNGWSQGNILTLVTLESAYLGLLRGLDRLRAGLGRSSRRQSVYHRGYSPGDDPVAFGAGHRSVGRHGDAGGPLPRLAGRPAGPHGRHPDRIALTRTISPPGPANQPRRAKMRTDCEIGTEVSVRSADDRSGERAQVVPERQPFGRGSAGSVAGSTRAGSRSSSGRAGRARARCST